MHTPSKFKFKVALHAENEVFRHLIYLTLLTMFHCRLLFFWYADHESDLNSFIWSIFVRITSGSRIKLRISEPYQSTLRQRIRRAKVFYKYQILDLAKTAFFCNMSLIFLCNGVGPDMVCSLWLFEARLLISLFFIIVVWFEVR